MLLTFLYSRQREVSGNDLSWRMRLLGKPAGKPAAAATDLQHSLAGQITF